MEDDKNLSEEKKDEITSESGKEEQTTNKKDTDFEKYCQMCRRPESVVGK